MLIGQGVLTLAVLLLATVSISVITLFPGLLNARLQFLAPVLKRSIMQLLMLWPSVAGYVNFFRSFIAPSVPRPSFL
jgi:hypothetical protein